MALPNPGMDAVPFTPLTAEFLDDMIENIQALSAGTGLANGAITTNTLAESAVTSQKLASVVYDVPYAAPFAVTTSNKVVYTATNRCFINVYMDFTSGASNTILTVGSSERGYLDPQRSRGNIGLWLNSGDILYIKGATAYTAGWLRVDTVIFT